MPSSLFAWPTRDRPELLLRGLSAWTQALTRAEVQAECLVCDASSKHPGALAEPLKEFVRQGRGKVFLADESLRREFALALEAKAGEGARFALGGLSRSGDLPPLSYGANRNLALLLSAGRTFAFCDDDVLPEFRAPSGHSDEAFESDEKDPTLIHPYRDTAELESISSPVEGLPLQAYPLLLTGTDSEMPLKPGAICFGTWGDSGMPSSRYLLINRALVSQEVYEDEAAYEAAMNSRTLLRATDAPIAGGLFFIAMHAILDASSLLPPFTPLGRGEDTLWGASIAALHPELAICHSPYSVHHAPQPRASIGRSGVIQWDVALDSFLLFIVAQRRTQGGPEAYRAVGAHVLELSRRKLEALKEVLWSITEAASASRLNTLERVLDAYDGNPSWWAKDMEAAMAAIRAGVDAYEPRAPKELADLGSFAEYLSGFGHMLQAWPETFEAARSLGPEFLEAARI